MGSSRKDTGNGQKTGNFQFFFDFRPLKKHFWNFFCRHNS